MTARLAHSVALNSSTVNGKEKTRGTVAEMNGITNQRFGVAIGEDLNEQTPHGTVIMKRTLHDTAPGMAMMCVEEHCPGGKAKHARFINSS